MLTVEVLVESELYSHSDTTNAERDFMGGTGKCDRLTILEDAVYVNQNGQQTVRFADVGAWKITTRRTGKVGDAGQVRFWIDALDSATRNDVSLASGGERLYCTANCWREQELAIGRRRIQPFLVALEEAQNRIDQRLEHATGDRRLDGTNPVDTAMASLDMAVLVKNRDDRLLELRDAERKLPATTSNDNYYSKPGMWPGTTENLVIAPGKIGVKRKKGLFGEEYHILGTWTATPLEGVSEFDEDEEEENELSSSE